jgi:hypothetical protein
MIVLDRSGLLKVAHFKTGAAQTLQVNGEGRVVILEDVRSGSREINVRTSPEGPGVVLGGSGAGGVSEVVTNGSNLVLENRVTVSGDVRINTLGVVNGVATYGNVQFKNELFGDGAVDIEAGDRDVTFDGAVGVRSLRIRTTGAVSMLRPVSIAEDMSVVASSVIFAARVVGTGRNTLSLAAEPGRSVGIGVAVAGGLNISGDSLQRVSNFGGVVIGGVSTPALAVGAVALDFAGMSGRVRLKADQIAVDPNASLSGVGASLQIETASADRAIVLGDSSGPAGAALLLGGPLLSTLRAGFGEVVIGASTNPVSIALSTPLQLLNATTIRGRSIAMQGVLSTSGSTLALESAEIALGNGGRAALIAPSGDVSLKASGGKITLRQDFTQLKAGGNLVLEAGQSVVELTGEIVVVGTVSVTNTGSIVANNLQLNALGTVMFRSTSGDIDLRGGFLVSQRDSLRLSAFGNVWLGQMRNTALFGLEVSLTASSYFIGSASSFGRVTATGAVSILYSAEFNLLNAASRLQAGSIVTILGADPSDAQVIRFGNAAASIPGGSLAAAAAQIRAQAGVTLSRVSWSVQQQLLIAAKTSDAVALNLQSGTLTAGTIVLCRSIGFDPVISPEMTLAPLPVLSNY